MSEQGKADEEEGGGGCLPSEETTASAEEAEAAKDEQLGDQEEEEEGFDVTGAIVEDITALACKITAEAVLSPKAEDLYQAFSQHERSLREDIVDSAGTLEEIIHEINDLRSSLFEDQELDESVAPDAGGPPSEEEVMDGILEAMSIQAKVQMEHLQLIEREREEELQERQALVIRCRTSDSTSTDWDAWSTLVERVRSYGAHRLAEMLNSLGDNRQSEAPSSRSSSSYRHDGASSSASSFPRIESWSTESGSMQSTPLISHTTRATNTAGFPRIQSWSTESGSMNSHYTPLMSHATGTTNTAGSSTTGGGGCYTWTTGTPGTLSSGAMSSAREVREGGVEAMMQQLETQQRRLVGLENELSQADERVSDLRERSVMLLGKVPKPGPRLIRLVGKLKMYAAWRMGHAHELLVKGRIQQAMRQWKALVRRERGLSLSQSCSQSRRGPVSSSAVPLPPHLQPAPPPPPPSAAFTRASQPFPNGSTSTSSSKYEEEEEEENEEHDLEESDDETFASMKPEVAAKLRELQKRLQGLQRKTVALEEELMGEKEQRERFLAELTAGPPEGVPVSEYRWVEPMEGHPGYEQGRALMDMIEKVTAMATVRIRELFVGIQEDLLLSMQDQGARLAPANGGGDEGDGGASCGSQPFSPQGPQDGEGYDGGAQVAARNEQQQQLDADLGGNEADADKMAMLEGLVEAMKQRLVTQAESVEELEQLLREKRAEMRDMESRVAALAGALERAEKGQEDYNPERQEALAGTIRSYAVRQMAAWQHRVEHRKGRQAFGRWLDATYPVQSLDHSDGSGSRPGLDIDGSDGH